MKWKGIGNYKTSIIIAIFKNKKNKPTVERVMKRVEAIFNIHAACAATTVKIQCIKLATIYINFFIGIRHV
jgi:hypothetical protein